VVWAVVMGAVQCCEGEAEARPKNISISSQSLVYIHISVLVVLVRHEGFQYWLTDELCAGTN